MTVRKVWTPERVDRLRGMLGVLPRPSLGDLAVSFGTTQAAVAKAIHRHVNGQRRGGTRDYRQPTLKNVRTERACMTCIDPFQSEGNWNRMCSRCRNLTTGIAA